MKIDKLLLLLSGVIILIGFVTILIFTRIKVYPPGVSRGTPPQCKLNNGQFINDFQIGNTSSKDSNNSCSDKFSSIPITNANGEIYNSLYPDVSTVTNLCKLNNSEICSNDSVVTDVEVVDMSSGKNTPETRWIPYTEDRCAKVPG